MPKAKESVTKTPAKKVAKESKKVAKVAEKSKTIVKKTEAPKKEKKVRETDPAKKSKMAKRFNKLRLKEGDLKSKGVIYIGHLPKGFEEEEIKKFFAQFGEVTKTRLARSKKTGRSKGYAFIEFQSKQVAEIAVQTMTGYLMFGKIVECHLMETPHKDTFKHGNREWNFVPNQLMFRNKKNAENDSKTPEQRAARVKGLLEKEKEKRIRLKELGITYEFSGYQGVVDAHMAQKPKKEEESKEAKKKSKKAKK